MKNKSLGSYFCHCLLALTGIIGLLFLQKTNIYHEVVVVQDQVDETGQISRKAILLTQSKINLSEIRYFTINYVTTAQNLPTKHLVYKDGLLYLEDVDLKNLQSFVSTVELYGAKTSLFKYLFASLE
ncbi:hypothetical protein SCLARK_00829 [Spiroplasma clarkii]|uniref:Uncharacterized protein n=1 Tax=Spiroplasma clarkii TaxID=2139 RepID=A0A1Y0L146_9MOLU|nr:hypothetical protein [Spiroplasma clarkii]ARU91448.1 hypothetical protein SCLARK_00829 [Spiroplasma clarkii]ATX70869.1 hypothetical protein SCLAR_v1c05500 [Spiroplasma clarkii]